jgi:hypothetical protein
MKRKGSKFGISTGNTLHRRRQPVPGKKSNFGYIQLPDNCSAPQLANKHGQCHFYPKQERNRSGMCPAQYRLSVNKQKRWELTDLDVVDSNGKVSRLPILHKSNRSETAGSHYAEAEWNFFMSPTCTKKHHKFSHPIIHISGTRKEALSRNLKGCGNYVRRPNILGTHVKFHPKLFWEDPIKAYLDYLADVDVEEIPQYKTFEDGRTFLFDQ